MHDRDSPYHPPNLTSHIHSSFHCSLCNYRSCLRGEARRHITRQHSNVKSAKVVYRAEEDVDKARLEQMVSSCFGSDKLKQQQQNPTYVEA